MKGQKCSINGIKYEKYIHKILKKCKYKNIIFNTQKSSELGGCSIKPDIICNYSKTKKIGIEIKKYNSPDWVQCSVKYDKLENKWKCSDKALLPKKCLKLFNILIKNANFYNNTIPPFFEKKITHDEWLDIKKNNTIYNDFYIDIPNDTINKMYYYKDCNYIQISNGFGLYHLGKDICNFNVPELIVQQRLRVRTKVHCKSDKNGFCKLSVTIACKPILNTLKKLKYSLDSIDKLPKNLQYIDNNNL